MPIDCTNNTIIDSMTHYTLLPLDTPHSRQLSPIPHAHARYLSDQIILIVQLVEFWFVKCMKSIWQPINGPGRPTFDHYNFYAHTVPVKYRIIIIHSCIRCPINVCAPDAGPELLPTKFPKSLIECVCVCVCVCSPDSNPFGCSIFHILMDRWAEIPMPTRT